MPYYGLYIPSKNGAPTIAATTTTTNSVNEQTSNRTNVFNTKDEALDVLKSNKDGRMREFQNEDDALKYAQTGYEEVVTPRYADPKGASTAAVEKAAFRAPTKQELIEFRKVIESGDVERVKTMIWDNPRYLVSSGDTPTTLKEGYRYNALHVCSISKKPKVAELILKTVSDPKFVDLLTGKKNDEKMCKELCKNLLDYYLNIPEKGRSETPLHLATKIGCIEMVELLTSYAECRMTMNSEGKCPKEIICTRQVGANPETARKIETLLEERFYVPVLRSVDNAVPPEIGEPFQLNNPPHLNTDPLSPEVKILALAGPMPQEQAKQFRRRWKTPPRVGSNSNSSPIANNPFISPRSSNMNLSITPTKNFNGIDNMRTPTTTLQRRALFNSSPRNSTQQQQTTNNKNENEIDFNADAQNEHITEANNNINANGYGEMASHESQEENTATKTINKNNFFIQPQHANLTCPATPIRRMNKTSFFAYRNPCVANDSPIVFGDEMTANNINNTTRSILTMTPTSNKISLNDSLQILQQPRDQLVDSPGYKERHVKISDSEKGLEVIGRELAREQKVEWREYWDFLDEYVDIATENGLLKLENYFAQRSRETTEKRTIKTTMATATVALDDVCSALEKLGFSRDAAGIQNAAILRNGGFSSDSVDGSGRNCNDMLFGSSSSANAAANISSSTSATTPYTCVEKSLQVFAKRMTKTIIQNVENVVCINDTLLSELKRLKSLICSFKEDTRFLDINFLKVHSRIANLISIYLQNSQEVTIAAKAKILVVVQNLQTTAGERREHIECVCSKIFEKLMNHDIHQILPENLKTEALCSKAWLKEQECECQWDNNFSRKTSRRNRMEARFKSGSQNMTRQQKDQNDGNTIDDDDWRCAATGHESSEEDFCSLSESDSDNEEIWYTPSSSPKPVEAKQAAANADYKLYVHGNEPTKRDLDVLNAIFHIEIDGKRHPHVLAWKTAMLCFPNEEMDYFPSPAIVKKSHAFSSSARKLVNTTPIKSESAAAATAAPTTPTTTKAKDKPNDEQSQKQQQTPAAVKQLFSAMPVRSKMFGNILGGGGGGGSDNMAVGPPKTPLNKLRGLFSSYRNTVENSPLPTSPVTGVSSPLINSNNANDDTKNLSLLNISTAE